MKKQKKLIALSTLAVMGLGMLSANRLRQTSWEDTPSQRKLTGNESIQLSSPKFSRNADGTFTETVHYALQPAGITGVSFIRLWTGFKTKTAPSIGKLSITPRKSKTMSPIPGTQWHRQFPLLAKKNSVVRFASIGQSKKTPAKPQKSRLTIPVNVLKKQR